jgi:hypothetical protein
VYSKCRTKSQFTDADKLFENLGTTVKVKVR